jgi:RNA recognition motif-containing protein
MATRIYVGSLPFSATDDQLLQLFTPFGEVTEAVVAIDRATNQSKGFGFIQMTDDAAAQAAITALNGSELGGRTLTVSPAKPREERSGGGNRSSYRDGGSRERRW